MLWLHLSAWLVKLSLGARHERKLCKWRHRDCRPYLGPVNMAKRRSCYPTCGDRSKRICSIWQFVLHIKLPHVQKRGAAARQSGSKSALGAKRAGPNRFSAEIFPVWFSYHARPVHGLGVVGYFIPLSSSTAAQRCSVKHDFWRVEVSCCSRHSCTIDTAARQIH